MQHAKHHENPSGGHVHRIHLMCDKEIKHKCVEEDRDLKQVLEVI